ncbi:MAG: zinc ribbon domain-containing protein [Candidatus Thiodiazotropha sp. (ex Lucinoma borealis)]|nr:zinc ribbon domain-containing protein [Candidatus Thiodiazotropha sp. (ex Lucinoma borealis)]
MELIVVVVLWLLLLPLAASIADSKGFSAWGYFIFALIFSPFIAILVALVTPANKEKQEERQLKEGKVKKCPYCAELVKNEASICKHCGRDLVDPQATPVEG